MGITNDASGCAVQITEQKIRSFPSHSRQTEEFFHGIGYFAIIVCQQHLTGQYNVPCLVFVKTAGVYEIFHIRNISGSHGFQRGVGGKQSGSDQIHSCVGALGRQTNGNHQFVILPVVQGTGGLRIAEF